MEVNKFYKGDSLKVLKTFPDESVDMVITSPPYWALRDYGVSGQLGIEPTYQEYIKKLCDIFDEVKRVLTKNGTCWVNIGDTYNSNQLAGNKKYGNESFNKNRPSRERTITPSKKKQNLPNKCLLMIPSRFAVEMCNRGWILRNEIVWHKPNCMPESVTDRFTTDFEKMYFFTKNQKYYFDQDTVSEPITDSSAIRLLQNVSEQKGSERANGGRKSNGTMKAVCRKSFNKSMGGGGTTFHNHSGYKKENGTFNIRPKRNKRSVWSIPTKPFREAHFAVYPEALIETPIQAGSPESGIVLDPFMGSGTTAIVSKKLNRNYVGIELNPEYIKIAESRVKNIQPYLLAA
jgi:DNA modification methylase